MVLVADTARRRRADRTIFNAAQYAISYGVAGGVLWLLGGAPDGNGVQAQELPALAAAGEAFLFVNTALASAPPALGEGASIWSEMRSDLGFQAWSLAVLVSLAPIVLLVLDDEPALAPLLALPLVAIGLGAHQATLNQFRARHDRLTGLPNRLELQERMTAALEDARRSGGAVALLLLDLDDFGEVNDTLGHPQGDALLVEVARRLTEVAHPDELIARFGGDEFALLTPRARDVRE